MRIILLTNDSDLGSRALNEVKNSQHDLVFCCVESKSTKNSFSKCGLNENLIIDEKQLYDVNFENIDLVVSYCFPHKIKEPVLSAPKYGCINFHPAPLPDYRGFAVYNYGILKNEKKWSVTAHCMEKEIDTGDILKSIEFDIKKNITVEQLREQSHEIMLKLLKDVLYNFHELFKSKIKQEGCGAYYSKNKMNKDRVVSKNDSIEQIDRKIMAFWCPPYHGASINIAGKEYTLVNSELLNTIYEKGE